VSSSDRLIFKSEDSKPVTLSDWSRDGKYMGYVQDNDVWALALSADGKTPPKAIQITKTPFIESLPRISPDNRWIAYVSNKTGQLEVYVQSFPEPGVEQQVSTGSIIGEAYGLALPHWSRDGSMLFYFAVGSARGLMGVSIKPTGTSLNAAAPASVLQHPAYRNPSTSYFSVTSDGRFLLQVAPGSAPTTGATGTAAATSATPGATEARDTIAILLNWAAKKRQ
jgi:Tol biopolymer transport system component